LDILLIRPILYLFIIINNDEKREQIDDKKETNKNINKETNKNIHKEANYIYIIIILNENYYNKKKLNN